MRGSLWSTGQGSLTFVMFGGVCVGGRGLMWSSGNDGSSLHVTNTIFCVLLAWAWFAKAIVVTRKNQPLPKPCTEKKTSKSVKHACHYATKKYR